MSAPSDFPPPAEPAVSPYGAVWLDELASAPAAETTWLWRGYLARSCVTLLSGQPKMGKTTLLAILLSRLARGGLLAGQDVTPGKALVVSEEPRDLWDPRCRRSGLGSHICLIARPFLGKPDEVQWLGLLDHLAELHSRHTVALVVIDSLAAFLPGHSENDATAMLRALLPLQRLTAQGLTVLLLHHPRKQAAGDGQAARGSGA